MPEALTDSPRILNSLVPGFAGNSVEGDLSFQVAGQGWNIIDTQDSPGKMFCWRGYLDLGGMEREALTFFIQNAQVLESNIPSGLGHFIEVTDVISKIEITDSDLNTPTATGHTYAPGFPDSLQDMEQVLWARRRSFFHDSNWTSDTLQQLYDSKIWGEGIATSAGRLHLTRYVGCSTNESALSVPPSCFQIVGTAVEEPDLNYIMRLRRDYELASQS